MPVVALSHVRVIDGTGARTKDDQTLVIESGRIRAIGDTADVKVPPSARLLDLSGRTVIPGLVGMHEHLFYQYQPPDSGPRAARAEHAFAKLYLASGVTTIRTAGTLDLAADMRIKRAIDEGRAPGPKIHVTGPYLTGSSSDPDPAAISNEVAAQADNGATSFKAYATLRGSELRAAVQAAHDRGFRITGHLCAVGFREAAEAGIDNVEHGLPYNTEFYSGKQQDQCPNQYAVFDEFASMDVGDLAIRETIGYLVNHGVAVTSTLAAIEMFTARESAEDPRMLGVLTPGLREQYRATRERWLDANSREVRLWAAMLRKEMTFERAFARAGGRLMAGVDPSGWGGLVAGFGDQRELELLNEAGFTAEEAIKIATANGADFLFELNETGSIAVGKRADLVVLRGNPSVRISDVRNVELVFKDGVGYDPAALIAEAQGAVHQYDFWHILYSPFDLFLIAIVAALFALVIRKRVRARHLQLARRAAGAVGVLTCIVAIGTAAACTPAHRQNPTTVRPASAETSDASAVPHMAWIPLHQGGADLSTGVYIREDDDLIVNTTVPIVLRRTYNSLDGFSRRFGLYATHAGEWWIYGDGDPRAPWGELILPDGARIRFVRVSPGDTKESAVLQHEGTRTEFNGALLRWADYRWEMRFRNGSLAWFLDCQRSRHACSLLERRDPDGHRIAYVRDRSGTLLKMESEGQSIRFEYDDHKRIVRASDTSQREVLYTYDDRGRLIRASGSDGAGRNYEYDERNLLTRVREPGRIVQNWYDDAGRWARQVVKGCEGDAEPYVATARYVVENGAIVESHFDEGDGLKITRYNSGHYIVSEMLDADGPAPIEFVYDRDSVTNEPTGTTMSCLGPSGRMTRAVVLRPNSDRATKAALVLEHCVRRR